MSPDAREFAIVVVGALLIVDVVYELARIWFKEKGGKNNRKR